jgi:hypothetical protein
MPFWDTPSQMQQVSTLTPQQQAIAKQQGNAIQSRGAGGAFGDAADYFRNNLSDDSSTFNAMAAPELRRFNEQTIPGLAEQFSGYGQLGSSGFQNSAVNAGTDLSERLGAIRANLRQQSAQSLMDLGNMGLNPQFENVQKPAQQGWGTNLIGAGLNAAATAFGGPAGGLAAQYAQSLFRPKMSQQPSYMTAPGTASGRFG